MGWLDWFITKDPKTHVETEAKIKLDKDGFVSDLLFGGERDREGGKHGHVWGLNSDDDKDIDGRNPK